jgi:hypothetical protein
MIKEIPKKIKVGDNWYSVEVVEALEDKYAMGSIEFTKRAIQLNSRSQSGKRYTPTEVKETFWHELVHAILVDMGEYRLNNKEQFVEQFAIRLSRAVKSARFK